MPESQNPASRLFPLAVPPWLSRAVAPWEIETAALWSSGAVELRLRSSLASIGVLVESSSTGSLAMALLDPRLSAAKGAAFVRALHQRLQQAAPLRAWLQRSRALAERLEAMDSADLSPELGCLIQAWRAWPARERGPAEQIAELPAAVRRLGLARATRAALIFHHFARGELLAALGEWEALPEAGASPSFIELHLDAVALALLGRRAEAIATLARAEQAAGDAEDWLAIARAHEALGTRESAIAAHERVVALRGRVWDRLRLARARGELGIGETLPRAEQSASLAERHSIARELVKIFEAAGRYQETLAVIDALGDAAPPELILRAAELHLWRREPARARSRLAALAELDDRARVILGAARVLEGHPAEGLAELERVDADGPAQLELWAWKTEAHLALDQLERALDCVDRHIVRENSLVAYLLKLLVLVRYESAEALARSLESRTFLDALVFDTLPTLCSAEQIAAVREHPERFAALLRGILDAMGGNRSAKPTWCRVGADGELRLEPVRARPSGRDAAVANLIRIRSEPPDRVLAGFDQVLADYPDSPHPCTYRGELLIWLGRYAQALASFDQADARSPTRWSYVGRAAAYDLLGEAEQADHWTHAGIEKFGELESATTHVYRGERLRKLGASREAQRDLETALAFKSRRIGARINLALVYRALDDEQGWARELDRLRVDAPAFLWEAGARADRPIDEATLLAALERMVGNRSSFLHTMIDRRGEFRVVPDPSVWIGHARMCVVLGREELGRELAARWYDGSGGAG